MVNPVSTYPTYVNRSYFDTERMAGSVPVWETSAGDSSSSAGALSMTNAQQPHGHTGPPPSLSFGEFLDIVNPLQHIPIVSGIYRNITGDEISPVARIIGGGIYGGPIGAVVSLVNAALEEHSGKDLVGNIMDAPNSTSQHAQALDQSLSRADIKWEDDISSPSHKTQWHFNT